MKDSKKNRKAPKQTKSKWTALDNEIAELKEKYDQISAKDIKSFKDVPLSLKTQQGLVNGKYENPTEIQKESIILALKGNDILGAAKTGSGKTLAFLIPVIECLFRVKWTPLDGLGALIISPTRELAYQIFEVLRIVGKRHDFSAGLVIGGKHLREEASRINKTNIVICTPGRLLQHMDETVNFNADNLQVLVLDEADRILDMGFQESVNAIIENLPATRQTLLFSATQTKSIKDLARLSLKDPVYVSVHENAKHSTPTQLQQSYILCELHEKLNILWSFVRNHLKNKILVFMATCKQVRYVSEVFKKLSPGITILGLHGSMQQLKRVATYESFCRKQHAVLFATDLAARGLDFPAVNWVVQLDCPEDANTYIHRAGRTARYETNGESLLILQPSEEKMIEELDHKKIPIDKISVNTKKMFSIQSNLESLCAAEVQVKEFAQRAFVAYLKSVFFMKNKAIFEVSKLDTDHFSRSLGLAMPPRIRFLKKALDAKKTKPDSKKMEKNISENDSDKDTFHSASKKVDESTEEEESSSSDSDDDTAREGDKSLSSDVFNFYVEDEEDNSDVLLVKSKSVTSDESDKDDDVDEETGVKGKTKTKVAVAKKILKKKLKVNTKTVFNEDGEEIIDVHKKVIQVVDESSDENVEGINLSEAKQRMEEVDKFDKALFRQKIKDRKKEKKMKLKERRKAEIEEAKDESEEDAAFVVGGAESDGFNSEDEDRFNTAEEGSVDSNEENQSSSMSTGDISSEDESSGSIDSEEFQQQKNRQLKRKGKVSQNLQALKRKRKAADDEDFNTGLSLQDDEELALKLLTNS